MIDFPHFLTQRLESGGFSTEDALASFLPLARQVLETHTSGFVAPLDGTSDLLVDGARIWFEQAKQQTPRRHEGALRSMESKTRAGVEVVAEIRRVAEVADDSPTDVNLAIADAEAPLTRPAYLPAYRAWEHRVEHHDAAADVFVLGLILASLACGLDFHDGQDLESFVGHRRNLFAIAPGLHPVLAQAIVRMTELDRRHRPSDLERLIHSLENYRDQKVDFELELAKFGGLAGEDARSKQSVVLRKLRERLFDISRRNRLLHFQATMQSVNLTHASVPLSFNIENVRPDQIFVWNEARESEFAAGKSLSLNRYLNFAEALYLPSILDRTLAEANRDRAEFGFAQLRVVACFLRWTNLKEKPIERYDSPLLLIPVELKKQKGVRDTYHLEPQSTEAEVNPVVRYEFKRLYDIDLPASIDLSETGADKFFEYLSARIAASEAAVTLQKIDRPRIALIHDKARRRLDQYRRRARFAGRGVHRFMDLDYSYDPANYHPLGVKLFSARVRPSESRLRTLIEEKPRPRSFAAPLPAAQIAEQERTFYSLEEGETNPYTWQFDLCSVTLANFKYRRMSLVRDYDSLIERKATNPAFEATFSLKPRPESRVLRDAPPIAERFDVVRCDPTQATAVGEARAGESYIIQGPPGTGKSQTITNLIADFVARGKRVLFVCEKRAAIDVVYARLRQCGLGELCCLIHDSQTDKKAFVADLKQTYDEFLEDREKKHPPARANILRQYANKLTPLEHVDARMQSPPTEGGLTLRGLLGRAISLDEHRAPLAPLETERLPDHATWNVHREQIEQFVETLEEVQTDGILANHPLRLLSPRIVALEHPLETVTAAIDRAIALFKRIEQALAKCGVPREYWESLDHGDQLVACLTHLAPLAEGEHLPLIDARTDRSKQFSSSIKTLEQRRVTLAAAQTDAKGWKERLPESEISRAVEMAEQFEKSHFAWLQPAWWRLRGVLRRGYDFGSHVIAPRWSQVLGTLQQLYVAEHEVEHAVQAIGAEYGITGDVDAVVRAVKSARDAIPSFSQPLQRLVGALISSPQAKSIVTRVQSAAPLLSQLRSELHAFVDDAGPRPLADIHHELQRGRDSLDDLPEFLFCLSQLNDLPPDLAGAFSHFPFTAATLEAASAAKSLEAAFRTDRTLARFSGQEQRHRTARMGALYDQLLDANAGEIRQRVRSRFHDHIRTSSLPAAQLDSAQKEYKKTYNAGRRILEHEFGKSMRYKPIRDLASGDSGEVVRDLKPVWLMSPLSVSDTLPLDAECFDVVIFDEASQITLEEAIPSLFRANQAIVVGDEMQLPPTSFFATKTDEEDEGLLIENEGELVSYELESNSFLNHAARNLPATMLGWHYRSRSESLISFSNWAFYEGRLLTVPEEQLMAIERPPLEPASEDNAEDNATANAEQLLQRAISFHYLRHGVYEQRRNSAEADYIARLVRSLLQQAPGQSIGIIAFSEAQQAEIDAALESLARDDAEFRDRYEAELQREEDGQFVGLLVKNLENIQGDERDIIILSVCYGHDPAGKLRMNFGPINISGGEKRLNVAFSRAKQHMAVVSSIRGDEITNEHNEGANCFKNYLRYAEAISHGRTDAASRVLHALSRWHELEGDDADEQPDEVAAQLSAALRERGLLVDHHVGQSHFRCDLAVRRPGDAAYRLGVLVDGHGYYDHADILERDVMRPRLLRDFGWNVCRVLAKDWYQDRQQVLDRVVRLIEGESDADVDAAAADSEEELSSDIAEEAPSELPTDIDADASDSLDPLPTSADSTLDAAPPSRKGGVTRYLEFIDAKSSKFWEITVTDNSHSVRFGRIGSAGQKMDRTFADAREAQTDADRLIRQKTAKGYEEKSR